MVNRDVETCAAATEPGCWLFDLDLPQRHGFRYPDTRCGRSSVVERQLPKLYVVGSIPIARSNKISNLEHNEREFSVASPSQAFALIPNDFARHGCSTR